MKSKKTFLLAVITVFTSALFCACNEDKTHSATDGGNVGIVKKSANGEDTSSTPNVEADTITRH